MLPRPCLHSRAEIEDFTVKLVTDVDQRGDYFLVRRRLPLARRNLREEAFRVSFARTRSPSARRHCAHLYNDMAGYALRKARRAAGEDCIDSVFISEHQKHNAHLFEHIACCR